MRSSSPSSAGATYLDRTARIQDLRVAARRAVERMPSIRSVILFGSLVNGIPTPRSDADLLVEVRDSAIPEPRNRVPDLLEALRPLPCPIDLFVLTTEEVERFSREGSPLLKTILAHGMSLV